MYLDKNRIIEALTIEQVKKLLESLGSDSPREGRNGELIFQSVCHGSESHKLYYYHEASGNYPARMFHCYSGCGDSFSCIELIIRANRCKGRSTTFYQALRYLAEITGNNITISSPISSQSDLISDWGFINKFKKSSYSTETEIKAVNENVLDMFYYVPHEEFLQDNISAETLSEFEISYYGLTNQIVIPHRDKYQKLIGVRGRYLNKEDIENIGKYVPLMINNEFLNHPLGENLYGIHINQSKIKHCKKCLLLESEKGVLQNHSYFGEDDFSLAVCGNNITPSQIRMLINDLEIDELILGFDKMFHKNGTFEEQAYRNKILKKLLPIVPYCRVFVLWDTEDLLEYKAAPTDYGKDVLLHMLDNKVEITMENIEEMLQQDE